jgi:putative DNA primase/helicase
MHTGGDALKNWAQRSESFTNIHAMVALAKSIEGISVSPDDFDGDPYLFAVANGVVDVRTQEHRPARPSDLLKAQAPVKYDASARCPVWERTLLRLLPDAEVRDFLQRFIGSCLTGIAQDKAIVWIVGEGDSGKTTVVETLQALLGLDYAKTVGKRTILRSKSGNDNSANDLAQLKGLRLAIVSELNEGEFLDEARVKALTGRNPVMGRYLYNEPFVFTPTNKILLETNHMPVVRDVDSAIWNRVKIVPFGVVLAKSEQDGKLPDRLRLELSGILNWTLDGARKWLEDGLGSPDAVSLAVQRYRTETEHPGRVHR